MATRQDFTGATPTLSEDYNLFWGAGLIINNSDSETERQFSAQEVRDGTYAQATGNGTHALVADPLLILPAAGNFELAPTSPAIDSGSSQDAPVTDLRQRPRFDAPEVANRGGGPLPYYDRGPLEWQGAGPTLRIRLAAARVLLSWPTNHQNFVPETQSRLDPAAAWTPLAGSTAILEGQWVWTNAVTPPAGFCRLRQTR